MNHSGAHIKILFILTAIFVSSSLYAQRGKQASPLFVDGLYYQNRGWFLAPGITYMLPELRKEQRADYFENNDGRDTIYSGDFTRKGRIGFFLEAGRHHFLYRGGIINHLDYGIHFKMLRGKESFEGLTKAGNLYVPVANTSTYSESFAGVFFNANNMLQISDKTWIQNSIGVNGDYRVISRRTEEMGFGAINMFPNSLLAQLHYKIGFGWKPEPGIYIIPMIETPILTAYPWEEGKSTLQYFVGRNRPLIFTLRIQWLSKIPERSCENQPGKNSPDLNKKHRKKSTNSLFGNDAKKMPGINKK